MARNEIYPAKGRTAAAERLARGKISPKRLGLSNFQADKRIHL
jgi:hypothetical protein